MFKCITHIIALLASTILDHRFSNRVPDDLGLFLWQPRTKKESHSQLHQKNSLFVYLPNQISGYEVL